MPKIWRTIQRLSCDKNLTYNPYAFKPSTYDVLLLNRLLANSRRKTTKNLLMRAWKIGSPNRYILESAYYQEWWPPLTMILKHNKQSVKCLLGQQRWTVNDLLATCAETRGVRCQPSDGATQFIRSAQTTHRVHAWPFLQKVGLLVEVGSSHPRRWISALDSTHRIKHVLGVDMSWTKRIDANGLGSELTCHTTGHLQYGRFARVVRNPGMVLRTAGRTVKSRIRLRELQWSMHIPYSWCFRSWMQSKWYYRDNYTSPSVFPQLAQWTRHH